MDKIEEAERVEGQSDSGGASPVEPMRAGPARARLVPQQVPLEPCPTCGVAGATAPQPPSFVYAIGEIDFLPSSESLDQEFSQIKIMQKDGLLRGVTDELERQKRILSAPEYRYIVRQLCWVLRIETLQTYILQPRDPADFSLLAEAFRSGRENVDVVIGVRGPMAPPELCGGLGLPIVVFDQLYYFDKDTFTKAIPKPEKAKPKEFEDSADRLFRRIQQIADNHGATDEHRAANYLAVRCSKLYERAHKTEADGFSLTAIDTAPSRLSGSRGRKIFDVIFTFTNSTDRVARKFFWRVDVTGEYPFIVTGEQEYFDRN